MDFLSDHSQVTRTACKYTLNSGQYRPHERYSDQGGQHIAQGNTSH